MSPYSNKVKSRKGNKDDQEDNVNLIKQATRDSASSIGTNDTPDRVSYLNLSIREGLEVILITYFCNPFPFGMCCPSCNVKLK